MTEFFVIGTPAPGGSKKAFVNPKTQRVVVIDDCSRNKDWRSAVSGAAYENVPEKFDGPLAVEFVFQVVRPRGHYGSGRNSNVLKPSAPVYPTVRPDVLKLSRSTEDSLSGIAFHDDSQIVDEHICKVYADTPGAWIRIRPMAEVDRSVDIRTQQQTLFERAS